MREIFDRRRLLARRIFAAPQRNTVQGRFYLSPTHSLLIERGLLALEAQLFAITF
jgi:hypothetical protein